MDEPAYILNNGTRIITNKSLASTTGMLIAEPHLQARKADTPGVIVGIVGGHGGDVYWVMHLDSKIRAAYGFMEFELIPIKDPCPVCDGSGFDWTESNSKKVGIGCNACSSTGERQGPRPTAWEHLEKNDL